MIPCFTRPKTILSLAASAGLALSRSSFCTSCEREEYKNRLKIGLCQLGAGSDKGANIAKAQSFISNAKNQGAEVVVLPEVRVYCLNLTLPFCHY